MRDMLAVGVLLAAVGNSVAMSDATTPPDWPEGWRTAWGAPSAELRPLQIVHGPPGGDRTEAGIEALKAAGLGGIVCNVNFNEYMTSEAHWETLIRAVEACRKAGLVVWIYDEDGYPSGAAGGLVLKADPKFEALALAYDASQKDPFVVRPAYEHTHASNNFYAARRYANLIDDEAMRCFVEKTHEAYWQRLRSYFGKTIVAFFTDEPSLMPVNLGQLGEDVRKRVRVVDPLDESVKPLPSVPWCGDLPDRYRQRYNEDIVAARRSLFAGDTEADRRVRRQFWSLVAEMIADRYFGRIQDWCRKHHVASSGHTLWEEQIVHHVPLEGNALKALCRMDIPGMDMLSSDPGTVLHGGWLTASLPMSAGLFNGGRRVMTEVSDFSQRMAKQDVTLAQMQATAAWQAAFGVTEFTSYYGTLGRIVRSVKTDKGKAEDEARAYCNYVGRLNALLRAARPCPNVLLYYPIYDLWAEYLPVAERLTLESQSKRAQQIVRSFLDLGRRLVRAQVSLAVVDHELLGAAELKDGGIGIGSNRFDAVVLPDGVELPEGAAKLVSGFVASGGCVMRGGAVDVKRMRQLRPLGGIEPSCDHVVVGRFVREERDILLVVNVGGKAYEGGVVVGGKPWWQADPGTGRIERRDVGGGTVRISLPAHSAILLVGPGAGTAG
ncbi:MAG: hypothetical protein JXQ73_07535 [Phycisphaerae bacterium]|nr:hypothetical protein [Phycisphaerae bacterium]